MWTIALTILITLLFVILAINVHTPERKVSHRVDHHYGIADRSFKRETGALLGPAIVSENRIIAMQNGDEIFPAMLEAIRGARHTITFETYIYWLGNIGEQFAQALIERASAGIKVHVMLDWLGSKRMHHALVNKMRSAGIEVQRYHPLRWYSLGKMNNRTRRKILVVDGMDGFTGGVGIADHAQDPQH